MGDYLFAALGALATVLGFGYWVLKATLVPREEFDKEIRAIENRLNAADLKTQQEHTSLASKQELKELEDMLKDSVIRLESGTKKVSDKDSPPRSPSVPNLGSARLLTLSIVSCKALTRLELSNFFRIT